MEIKRDMKVCSQDNAVNKNVGYFLDSPGIVVKAVKETNSTGLPDAKLTWYSPSTTRRICLYGLEHGYRIHSFRPT